MLQHVDWYPADRYIFLWGLPKGGVIAEVGVHLGDYAKWILDVVNPDLLYLVDVWPDKMIRNGADVINGLEAYEHVKNRFKDEIESGRVKIIRDDSRELYKYVMPNTIDWLYLDTDHWYPTTIHELEALSPLVKPNGYIFGHDYNHVTRQGFNSVGRSVEEFLSNTDYRLVMYTFDRGINSFGISRRD